jgi:anti-sigma regulatory factor (Ser/Thr protein kinase)
MRFFENFGLEDLGKQGLPRAPGGRFSVIQRVSAVTENDRIAHDIVEVQQPSAEAYQIYQHIVSEALDNISQHSTAEGFTASQYYQSQGRSAFCIADYGRGLRTALERFDLENDEEAIRKALEVGVSGRSRTQQLAEPEQTRNRGVGLSIIRQLIVKNDGQLRIWTGSAVYIEEGDDVQVRSVPEWKGVLLTAVLPRNRIVAPFDERDSFGTAASRSRATAPRGPIAVMDDAMSEIVFNVPFLGSRNTARRLRLVVSAACGGQNGCRVLVDFSGVSGVSHSFADELLSPLSEQFGTELSNRVSFVNCADSVERVFGVVADMHGLKLPKFERRTRSPTSRVSVDT